MRPVAGARRVSARIDMRGHVSRTRWPNWRPWKGWITHERPWSGLELQGYELGLVVRDGLRTVVQVLERSDGTVAVYGEPVGRTKVDRAVVRRDLLLYWARVQMARDDYERDNQ